MQNSTLTALLVTEKRNCYPNPKVPILTQLQGQNHVVLDSELSYSLHLIFICVFSKSLASVKYARVCAAQLVKWHGWGRKHEGPSWSNPLWTWLSEDHMSAMLARVKGLLSHWACVPILSQHLFPYLLRTSVFLSVKMRRTGSALGALSWLVLCRYMFSLHSIKNDRWIWWLKTISLSCFISLCIFCIIWVLPVSWTEPKTSDDFFSLTHF